ncbi:MAG: gamma-glutamylcyclotransferase [candidate division Zixibacteria bacterium]|nr:gamma-glutamylcyclotransferase [candidate division Zixibacteria bacterium]
MTQKLFIYGSLGPGQPNERILTAIGGIWEPATVRGYLKQCGWGSEMGYPAIVLDEEGVEVSGFVFSSDNLDKHWNELDDFEGDEYERVIAEVHMDDNRTIEAHVYGFDWIIA